MSGFPVNGKFGLFHRFEAEKSKKIGKSAFTVKFLTVIKKKVKIGRGIGKGRRRKDGAIRKRI